MQRELEFKLKHITLRGMGFGDSNKPMILALHGWLDNAASFAPLAPYLADYYVLAIDLAGHGLSDHRSPDAHYHLLDFVYDLHELVEIQGWQRFVLMGHSLGAIIASLYASSFTERVDRLICIEALGPLTKSATTSASQLRESILNRLNLSTSPSTRPKTIARVINARAFVGELSVSSAELLVRRNTSERDGQLFYRTDRRLRTVSALRMTEEQARAFVSSIVCPVLLITGDKGFETFASEIKDRMTRLNLGQHVCCSGNHHVHMENPTDVALKVVNFLE